MYMFYYISYTTNTDNKGDKYMEDNQSYLINGINKDLWIKFKIKCLKSDHKTIADCFRWFIKEYSRGNI